MKQIPLKLIACTSTQKPEETQIDEEDDWDTF